MRFFTIEIYFFIDIVQEKEGNMTPDQVRAALGFLDWNYEKLSEKTGLTPNTIGNFLAGKPYINKTFNALQRVFEQEGIEFIDNGQGVRRKTSNVIVLQGAKGFWDFYTDIYETIRDGGGEILVSNVEEGLFAKWFGDRLEEHRTRMYPLSNYDLKILLEEGDTNFLSKYERAEYRWSTEQRQYEVPFYVYGEKLAFIIFEKDNVTILIHDHPKMTAAFRQMFYTQWDKAIIPPKEKSK